VRQRIGPYRIEKVIGKGGMGLVYKGRHDTLDRCAAIKALLPENALDSVARQRLTHEARAQALSTHDNVVTVYDFLPEDGQLFIAMEYVDGETLTALVQRSPHGRLAAGDALPLMLQVLAALEHVHRQKITHRDVKPSNVLVCGGVAKLTDFGIALLPDAPRVTAQQQMIGTREYMSPEQLQGGDVDYRSDIYSAGLVLYTMLAGCLAFPARDPLSALAQRLAGPPDPRRTVPDLAAGLWEALHMALQAEPERRFQSAASFRDVLQDIAAGFLQPVFDPQEDIPTEVLHESVVEAEESVPLPETQTRPLMPWIVIATSVTAAGYVLVNQRPRAPAVMPVVTQAEVMPQLPRSDTTATSTTPPTADDMVDEPQVADVSATVTGTTEDTTARREREIAMLREEIRVGLDQAENLLRAERFDEAVQEFESAARSAQKYPDELSPERERIAGLRTRLIDARVAAEMRTQQNALWSQRIARIEQYLRDRQWPEARRDSEEILSDAQAPAEVADQARDLLRRAKEGLVGEFRQTQVGATSNTTVRKPSSPPRKND
jgi:eukaryotic-like serine/threonine-protein kinase